MNFLFDVLKNVDTVGLSKEISTVLEHRDDIEKGTRLIMRAPYLLPFKRNRLEKPEHKECDLRQFLMSDCHIVFQTWFVSSGIPTSENLKGYSNTPCTVFLHVHAGFSV